MEATATRVARHQRTRTAGRWRLLSALAAALVMLLVLVASPARAWALGSFGVNQGHPGYTNKFAYPQCTWYAWGRAYEKCGVSLPVSGNGQDWLREAQNAGWRFGTGSEPRVNSVVVMQGVGANTSAYGHVAFVESVSGSQITYSESNRYDSTLWGLYNERTINGSVGTVIDGGAWGLKVIGYIYCQEAGNPIPGKTSGKPYVDFAEGDYVIRSFIGGHVLDIDGARLHENGANAQLWRPEDNVDQIFHIKYCDNITAKGTWTGGYRISLKESGKNLDAEGNVGATITNVLQWDNYNGSNQHWVFEDAGDGWVYIANKNGYYLDVVGGWDSNYSGGNVQAYEFNGSDAQKWKVQRVSGKPMERIGDGDYVIRSAVGSKVLHIQGASKDMGANAKIYQPDGTAAQIFRIGKDPAIPANNIRLSQTGNENRWLDKEGGDGTGNVFQWEGNGGNGQNWFFEPAGSGWYYIRNMYGYYLDVKDGKNENSTNVQCWVFNGSTAQKWKPVRVSGKVRTLSGKRGTYTIRSAQSNRMLDVSNASSAEGAIVQVYEENGGGAQLFRLGWNATLTASHLRLLQPENDNRYIDANKSDGPQNVSQYAGNGGASQNWLFEDAGSGWYYVRNLNGYYLDSAGDKVAGAKDAGATKVRVTTFNGSNTQKWKLEAPKLSYATISAIADQTHTGAAIAPEPKVTYGGITLKKDTDYALSYANNVDAGTATLTVSGKGSYAGSKKVTFKIVAPSGPDLSRDGWVDLGGGKKGYARGGKLVTGWFDLGSSKYYFQPDGSMSTGWTDVVVDGKTMHYYFNPASGNLVRDTWFTIGDTTYYFRPSGNLATGWATIDDNGTDKKYYFREDGSLVKDAWYDVVNDSGVTNHYYFRPSGAMATGWATIGGQKYFFRPSGNMATGFADVDDAYKRYFDPDGIMQVGWRTIGSGTYYFRASGAMQTGKATIDGKAYTFTDKGVLVG